METKTTIRKMMANNKIIVPPYQRAYSWDTPIEHTDKNKKTQVDIFLKDLEEYSKSNATNPYYFGHFLFEKKGESEFYVIDGQQRLTTIVIFLSALFSKLKEVRTLTEEEEMIYEDMIKRKSIIRFSTVSYDQELFKDYVVEQRKHDPYGIETESARRIIRAFDFFKQKLSDKDESYLTKMLSIVSGANCTTHVVNDESEAIQMFIFQNNRGKSPTNLEIIKAQFMYNAHLYSANNNERKAIISEIQSKFEKIYRSISSIEYNINEDDVLLYTLRVHFNSLWEDNPVNRINKQLSYDNSIEFIKNFTYSLYISFDHLSSFFGKDEKKYFAIHSLVTLGGIGIAIPFIIKAYKFGLSMGKICELCEILESLLLRHRIIGTRADIRSRINDIFDQFSDTNSDIKPIKERIEFLKTTDDWWWAYWNNKKLEEALQGEISPAVAKYLLWKYENYLRTKGKSGYNPIRYDQIENPELEHIAPRNEPEVKPHGYDVYDEENRNKYINCLGNYLLLSKSHNASIHNDPFPKKYVDYDYLEQQKEIKELVLNPENPVWDRNLIQKRKEMIIDFVMKTF